jgi:hypothetical protein
MQRVVYPQEVKTNCFTVHRVANGWLVQMPQMYHVQEQENIYAGLVPALKEVMKFQNEDPLLSELRGEEQEPEQPKKMPIIGRDESLYVCKSFQEVLELLLTKFGNLKA